MDTYYSLDDYGEIAKEDSSGNYFVWSGSDWKPVHFSYVKDLLYGYDPTEPEDSPYRFGGHIGAHAISEEEAMAAIGNVEAGE